MKLVLLIWFAIGLICLLVDFIFKHHEWVDRWTEEFDNGESWFERRTKDLFCCLVIIALGPGGIILFVP